MFRESEWTVGRVAVQWHLAAETVRRLAAAAETLRREFEIWQARRRLHRLLSTDGNMLKDVALSTGDIERVVRYGRDGRR